VITPASWRLQSSQAKDSQNLELGYKRQSERSREREKGLTLKKKKGLVSNGSTGFSRMTVIESHEIIFLKIDFGF
jgi:hypothetical protein